VRANATRLTRVLLMISPTGLIPESLMYREKKNEVIALLQSKAWPALMEQSGFDGVNYGRNY